MVFFVTTEVIIIYFSNAKKRFYKKIIKKVWNMLAMQVWNNTGVITR